MNIFNLGNDNKFVLLIKYFIILFIFLLLLSFTITGNINLIALGVIIIFFVITLFRCIYKYQYKENFIETRDDLDNLTYSLLTKNNEIHDNSNASKINVLTSYGDNGKKKESNNIPLKEILKEDYYKSDWRNPFGNMLLPEIKYDVERKSAPPSFNLDVAQDITKNVKMAVQKINPKIKNTNKQLFGDLYNKFLLDNSNRVFYSMPNTRVENDQSAFANFLYHDLIFTGKESTVEGGIARIQDNYRYILY